MNIQKEIIDNQTLHSHALFFDPVEKDLVLASDEKGRPMGRYVPKPTGVQVLENGDVIFRYYAPNAKSVQVAGIGGTMGTQRYDLSPRGDGYWRPLSPASAPVSITMIIMWMATAPAATWLPMDTAASEC